MIDDDILINCCLFCSINFIIHRRWPRFFASQSRFFSLPLSASASFSFDLLELSIKIHVLITGWMSRDFFDTRLSIFHWRNFQIFLQIVYRFGSCFIHWFRVMDKEFLNLQNFQLIRWRNYQMYFDCHLHPMEIVNHTNGFLSNWIPK